MLTERALVRPGELVFGTDSHSTTYGAVAAAGNGIGVTETTYLLATGELWMQVPPTLRFALEGELPAGLMSKDVALHLAGRFGTAVASYRAIEFAGPAADAMSLASRMTLANMGVELGAKFAFFAADEATGAATSPSAPASPSRPSAPTRTRATRRRTASTSAASSRRSPAPTTRAT